MNVNINPIINSVQGSTLLMKIGPVENVKVNTIEGTYILLHLQHHQRVTDINKN